MRGGQRSATFTAPDGVGAELPSANEKGSHVRLGERVSAAENGSRPAIAPNDEQRRKAALVLIERYERALRRTARRFSRCAEDADDAYQRAIEILLSKAPVLEPDRLVRWMHTVTRHEAYAVRRQRGRFQEISTVESEEGTALNAVDLVPSDSPEPFESSARHERLSRSREALRALKPNEIRALTLKAEGYSYAEIGEITGWTHTKINRNMVEGRRRFLSAFAEIEEGKRCEELARPLSRFSDGEASAEDRDAIKLHLDQCSHCKAKLRAFRGVPQRVLEVAPAGVLAGPSLVDRLGDGISAAGERARDAVASIAHRGTGVEATQTVAAAGGTRGSGLALLGVVCGIGAAGGGAAVCVETGVIPDPFGKPAVETQVPASLDAPAPAAPETDEAKTSEPQAPEERPVVQERREFGFEQESSGGSTEFGGPAGGGGSSSTSGGGSAGGSGGFGFEK